MLSINMSDVMNVINSIKTYLIAIGIIIVAAIIIQIAVSIGIADTESAVTIYYKEGVAWSLVHLMVFPHSVHKECLHLCLQIHVDRVDGREKVGVMQHHLCRLLCSRVPLVLEIHADSGNDCSCRQFQVRAARLCQDCRYGCRGYHHH